MKTAFVALLALAAAPALAQERVCCKAINAKCRSCELGISEDDYCYKCTHQGLNDAGCFDCPRNVAVPTSLSACQIQAQQGMGIPGRFSPQCNADGSYNTLQCHGSTGYCWCVDNNGQELEGTRQPPGHTPDCSKTGMSPCMLQSIQASHGYGGFRPRCEPDGSYSALQCHGSTGYCWCSTSDGIEIDGTRVAPGSMPNCTRSSSFSLLVAELTPCQLQVEQAAGLIGQFVPQCKRDGTYSSLQCHGSTGYCWCVTDDGTEIDGSRKGPGDMPACSVYSVGLCELQRTQASRGYGTFRPQCADDGSFNKMQCHGSTGYCWCVDTTTGVEINNTRVAPGNMPNCDGVELTDCQTKVAAAAPVFGAYVPQCEEDGSYSSLQCHGSTGYCWCARADGSEIPGTRKGPGIPVNCTGTTTTLSACQTEAMQASKGYGSFRPQCEADGSYSRLQCHGSTGYCWCVESDGKAIASTRRGPGNVPDCNTLQDAKLSACQMQVAQSSRLLGAFTPQCEADGSYSSLQCHASTGYCWCVDANGQEVNNTRSGPGRVPDCTAVPLTPCQLQQTQASHGYGSFSPQCNDDGSYNTMQCHPSTGYCWCVTADGVELNGTRVAPGNLPNCSRSHNNYLFLAVSSVERDPSECEQLAASSAGRIGAFTPQCEKDGSYSALQCWASTGNCWCVNSTGVEFQGSRHGPGQGVPDCDLFALSPCQLQRKQASVGFGSFRPRCNDDGTYSALQCHGSTGHCWCVSADGTKISGTETGPGGVPTCANLNRRSPLAPRRA